MTVMFTYTTLCKWKTKRDAFFTINVADEDGIPWERIRGLNNGRWERMWKKCEEFMEVK